MPHEFLNLAMAGLFAIGLFAILFVSLPGISFGWSKLDEAQREKVSAVFTYLFGKDVDPVDTLALIFFGATAVAVALFLAGLTPASIVMFLALGLAIPIFMYSRAASLRARELELALPLALQQVANEMGAGATLETALKKVAETAPAPADVEMGRLQRRVEIMGIDDAFSDMAQQLGSPSFTLTASVVRVGTSSGGRLIEALKSLSQTLIEIERLNKKLRTASENGRRNLYLMSLVGPVVAVASSMVVDHEVGVLETSFGQALIGGAILCFFMAHVLGHKLTQVKV